MYDIFEKSDIFQKCCSLVFLSCNCDNKQLTILTLSKLGGGINFRPIRSANGDCLKTQCMQPKKATEKQYTLP